MAQNAEPTPPAPTNRIRMHTTVPVISARLSTLNTTLSDGKRAEIADMGSGLSRGQGEAAATTVVAAAASLTR
jgi:hypothetical protein